MDNAVKQAGADAHESVAQAARHAEALSMRRDEIEARLSEMGYRIVFNLNAAPADKQRLYRVDVDGEQSLVVLEDELLKGIQGAQDPVQLQSDNVLGIRFRTVLHEVGAGGGERAQIAQAALKAFNEVYDNWEESERWTAIGFDIRTGAGSAWSESLHPDVNVLVLRTLEQHLPGGELEVPAREVVRLAVEWSEIMDKLSAQPGFSGRERQRTNGPGKASGLNETVLDQVRRAYDLFDRALLEAALPSNAKGLAQIAADAKRDTLLWVVEMLPRRASLQEAKDAHPLFVAGVEEAGAALKDGDYSTARFPRVGEEARAEIEARKDVLSWVLDTLPPELATRSEADAKAQLDRFETSSSAGAARSAWQDAWAEAGAGDTDIELIGKAGGYPALLEDGKKLEELQDVLDACLHARLIDVRDRLRNTGWVGEKYGELRIDAPPMTLALDHQLRQVGPGRNVVGIEYVVFDASDGAGYKQSAPIVRLKDSMSEPAEAMAAMLQAELAANLMGRGADMVKVISEEDLEP